MNKKVRASKDAADGTMSLLQKLRTPEFSHWKLLLFWPFFGLAFLFLERLQPQRSYHAVSCALDDLIPFCEWALLPYLFWFVFLIGALVYTFFCDTRAFRSMMRFTIITYSITIIIYAVYPTCQNLRPVSFARENLLTQIVGWLYQFDTNTNVCPSLHVIGSFAAMFALWDCKRFQKRSWKLLYAFLAISISVSTVFMKQHSIVDVFAAILVCTIGGLCCYRAKHKSTVEVQHG